MSVEVDRVREDWEINPGAMEIARAARGWRRRVSDIFWKRKYTVVALYSYLTGYAASMIGITYPVPMVTATTKVKGRIRGEFRLSGGWTIPKRDLKYLIEGPLMSQAGNEIVPAYTRLEKLKRRGAPVFKLVVAGVIAAILDLIIRMLF